MQISEKTERASGNARTRNTMGAFTRTASKSRFPAVPSLQFALAKEGRYHVSNFDRSSSTKARANRAQGVEVRANTVPPNASIKTANY